jgi:hypothetical protein
MGVAGREVEISFRGDGPHRTGGHAEFAFQTRVVVDRLVGLRNLGIQQDGPQQDEIAELLMDHVAMNAHHSQPCRHRDRLV